MRDYSIPEETLVPAGKTSRIPLPSLLQSQRPARRKIAPSCLAMEVAMPKKTSTQASRSAVLDHA